MKPKEMSPRMLLLGVLGLFGCGSPTEPRMVATDTALEARKADGYNPPTVPDICQLPGHANSPACAAALGAIGLSFTYIAESCMGWNPACVRALIATATALYAFDHAEDQHGHARGREIGGNGGERQDEGLRIIWPGDEGYNPRPPFAGQGDDPHRSWWGGLVRP